jgi:L-cysteine/cystine lyase
MDPAEFRARFPVLERVAYLNAGSDGPLPAAAVAAAREALDAAEREGRTRAHFQARIDAGEELRGVYASLLGCDRADVALTTSTSEGLARVLAGMRLEPGDEVLVAEGEHPGLLGPVMAARARGVRVRTGPLATLADHVRADTTVVCCSHVGWATGELADPRLADTGVPLVLDGAQSIGAVPVDVRELNCLAYAGSGQKWLCGADGTGMLYLADRERVAFTAPAYLGFETPSAGLESGFHDDARPYDTPTLPREGVVTSLVAARELEAFGWDALFERAHDLAGRLAGELESRDRRVGRRSRTTLVAWEDDDPEATVARLAQRDVLIRFLPGTPYLRASVGAWTDETDLDRLLEAL